MAAPAIEYAYSYPFASEVRSTPKGPDLRLATFGGSERYPYFYKGKLVQPRRIADLLLTLSLVSRTRFYMPPNMLARILAAADPVVTSGGERLRFEAFSVCCGVYARVDLHPEALDGEWIGRGTTNVDFNPPMRNALAKLLSSDLVGINVGADRLELEKEGQCVVEKKVRLPVRWIKGFVEVQSYQSRMKPVLEIPGTEAARFLRDLPRQVSHAGISYAVPSGRGLRLSQRSSSGAVAVGGPGRLKALEDIARYSKALRIYGGSDGVSGWELVTEDARFHMVLSPEAARGFSGEGQVLAELAGTRTVDAVGPVRATLAWQARVDAKAIAAKTGCDSETVSTALSVLGTRGLVGYDLEEGSFFHRELPFDMEAVEELQPRLKNARKLVQEKAVRIINRTRNADGVSVEAYVKGTDVEHRVRIEGDQARCTWLRLLLSTGPA